MTPVESAIRDFVREHAEAETRFLAEIVKVPSDNPPGDCSRSAEVVATLLEGLGFQVERHKVPEALVKANGMISATNLIVRRRFRQGPTIALNAHGDVVPPGAGWTHDPYGAEIVDGWMVGRGAAVSKSDIATYAFAMLALEKCGAALNGAVELHVTYDEEAGGEIGPRYLLEQGLSRPDLAIGAGFSYAVVNAHNGALHLEVEVLGRSAHAARPSTGVDALEAANAILSALYGWRERASGADLGDRRYRFAADDGRAHSGWDQHQCGAGSRDLPPGPAHCAGGKSGRGRGGVARGHRPRGGASSCSQGRGQAHPACRAADADPGWSEADRGSVPRTRAGSWAKTIAASGVPLYTDARHYAKAGVPIVLYGAGPRTIEEANAHRADERLPLSDLYKATEVIALTLAELLQRAGTGG